MRIEVIEDEESNFSFWAVTLEVVHRYSRDKKKVKRGIVTDNGFFPRITDMLGLIKNDEGAGNCTVLKVEELATRKEYLKIKTK